MSKRKLWIMMSVLMTGLLGLPVYCIVGLITAPIGLGLLMLVNHSPWILKFYPFMFAGEGSWYAPVHYLDPVISLPLTALQWILMAWLAGEGLRDVKPNRLPLAVLALLFLMWLAISFILAVTGIEVLWASARM